MQLTDRQKLERRVIHQFSQGVKEFHLLEQGDHVLVGLSGGKDSLALFQLLALFARNRKPEFQIDAVHVKMKNVNYQSNLDYLKDFAEKNSAAFHLLEGEFEKRPENRKPACFLCSWTRRKLIFNLAQDLGCNKIALGHHNDDILHTALMNEFFEGSFSTMPVKLRMKKFPISIIRPLCKIREKDLVEWAKQNQFPQQIKNCPYEHESKRTAARKVFEELEKQNPEVRFSLWHALQKANKLLEE